MSHHLDEERLSALADGDLEGPAMDAALAHLAECAACTAELQTIRALTRSLAGLTREAVPSTDLWPAISARIGSPRAIGSTSPAIGADAAHEPRGNVHTLEPRRTRPSLRMFALAASIVVAIFGITRLAGSLETRSEPDGPPIAVRARQVAFVAFVPSEDAYRTAAAELVAALEARRGSIRPETLAVIEANLKIIDASITHIREALARDPASADLTFLLSSAYQAKLDLLRQVTRLPDRT